MNEITFKWKFIGIYKKGENFQVKKKVHTLFEDTE